MMTQAGPPARPGEWFYQVGGQKNGPIAIAELQRLVRSGQLGPQVLVWTEGMPSWVPAGNLPVLYPRDAAGEAMLGLVVPTGNISSLAIAAGYLGLLGLVMWPLALVGLVLGILAVRDVKRHPEKKGLGRAITGIVCGALVTVGFVLLIAIARLSR